MFLIWYCYTQGTALGIVQTLMPYMILRFALGFVSMSIVNISFVLTVEMVTGKWSSIIGTLDLLPLPIAYIIIAGIAYVTRNWRHLQFIVSIPWFGLLLFWSVKKTNPELSHYSEVLWRIFSLIWIFGEPFRHVLPESPRWLLAKGRVDELKKIIETAARWNKITLPPNYEKHLIVPAEEDSNGSLLDLFKLEYLRTTLLLMVAWYTLVLQYMAITLHIGEMGGNIYLTTVSTMFFFFFFMFRNNWTQVNILCFIDLLCNFYKAVRTQWSLICWKQKSFSSQTSQMQRQSLVHAKQRQSLHCDCFKLFRYMLVYLKALLSSSRYLQ